MKYFAIPMATFLLSCCGPSSSKTEPSSEGEAATKVEKAVANIADFGSCSKITKDVWENWPNYASFQTAIDQADKRIIFWARDPKESGMVSKKADDFSEINLPKGSLASISVGDVKSLSDRGNGSEIYLQADTDSVIVFKNANFVCRPNG